MARLPGSSEGMTSPVICVVIAAASRTMPAASMQLKPAHMAVEPVSAAMTGANLAAGRADQVGRLVEQVPARRRRHRRPGRKRRGSRIDGALGIGGAGGRGPRGDAAGHGVEPVEGGAARGALVGVVDHQVYGNHRLAPWGCFVGLRRGGGRRPVRLQRRLARPAVPAVPCRSCRAVSCRCVTRPFPSARSGPRAGM